MADGFKERFRGDDTCRQQCIDRVLFFLNSTYTKSSAIQEANTLRDIHNLLKEQSSGVHIYIHPSLLFLPPCFRLTLSRDVQTTFNTDAFIKSASSQVHYGILHLMTAKQIYGIDECWSHFVCELYDHGKSEFYDPFLEKCMRDYPNEMFSYQEPTRSEIMTKRVISFLTWLSPE